MAPAAQAFRCGRDFSAWVGLTTSEEVRKVLTDKIPLCPLGRPEEVAAAALFLASVEISLIAGRRTLHRRRHVPGIRDIRNVTLDVGRT